MATVRGLKDRQNRITNKFQDFVLARFDRARDDVEIGVERIEKLVRGEPLGQGRKTIEDAEPDRRPLPLL